MIRYDRLDQELAVLEIPKTYKQGAAAQEE